MKMLIRIEEVKEVYLYHLIRMDFKVFKALILQRALAGARIIILYHVRSLYNSGT